MQPGAARRRSTPRPGQSTPSPRSRSGRSARSSSPRSHAARPRRSVRWIRAPDRTEEQLGVTNTRHGIEVELKYRVRDADAAARLGALRTLGGLRVAGRPRQVQVEDRYLDTADGALSRAGYAVRLRRGPRMTILSVKASNEAASALHRREEIEGPADLSLDPHAWAPSAARSLVLEHAGDSRLIEIVTIRQLRRARSSFEVVTGSSAASAPRI